MPFDVAWIHPQRVTYGRFYGEITVDEVHEANQVAMERIKQGTPPVYVIVNTLDIDKIPTSLKSMQDIVAYVREPNLGMIVYISDNRLISFFNTVVSQLSNASFYTVKSMDEALALIQRMAPDLPKLEQP